MAYRFANDILLDETDVTSDVTSEVLDMSYLDSFSAQVIATGTIVGTVSIEASNNGVDWSTYASPTAPVSGATNRILVLAAFPFKFARLFFDSTSGTTNTLKILANAKG